MQLESPSWLGLLVISGVAHPSQDSYQTTLAKSTTSINRQCESIPSLAGLGPEDRVRGDGCPRSTGKQGEG